MATEVTPTATVGPLPQSELSDDCLNLLDRLISQCYRALEEQQKTKPKLGDFLKMIELRRKLTPHDASQKELWAMLEKVRREVLESGDAVLSADVVNPETQAPVRTAKVQK